MPGNDSDVTSHDLHPSQVQDQRTLRIQDEALRADAHPDIAVAGIVGIRALGKAGETGKDAGTASQVSIGTGVTIRKNTAALDTKKIDLKNLGNIITGIELTAARATYSFLASRGVLDVVKFLNVRGLL